MLTKRQLVDFISILPDWDDLSKGLDAVVLDEGDSGCDGWYGDGVVAICAWERELWRNVCPSYFRDHLGVFDRLGVVCEKQGQQYLCRFTDQTARAFQLVHVFLHELGHRHDRMTTRVKRNANRGEDFAERYALNYAKVIWDRYVEVFGLD